jgi:hypothetical protein
MKLFDVLHKFSITPTFETLHLNVKSDVCSIKKLKTKKGVFVSVLTIKNKTHKQNIKVKDECLDFLGEGFQIEKSIFINTYKGYIKICESQIAEFCKIHRLKYHLNMWKIINIYVPKLTWTPNRHFYFNDIRYNSFRADIFTFLLICNRLNVLNKDMKFNVINELCLLHQDEIGIKNVTYLRISKDEAYTTCKNIAPVLFWFDKMKEYVVNI